MKLKKKPPSYFNVALLAAAALVLESALLRLLAVAQFYHFAFLVISLALLGYGASGSLLTKWAPHSRFTTNEFFNASGIGFAISVGVAYWLINRLPFDSYSIAWETRQVILFVLYYFTLTIPFLCAGLGIGVVLSSAPDKSHLAYSANLIGSGLGALLAPPLLWLAGVPGAILASGMLGGFAGLNRPGSRWKWVKSMVLCSGLVWLVFLSTQNLSESHSINLTISPYKGLVQALRFPTAAHQFGRWNSFSRVDVLASAGTRQFPGLSYNFTGDVPLQKGLSVDAGYTKPITLVAPADFEAGTALPEALAFQLRPNATVLVLEPAGGLGVLQALAGGASQVTAVLDNPLIPEAVAKTAQEFNVYTHPQVNTQVESSRGFLTAAAETFDIIFFPLTDAYLPVTSGAYSLSENYHLTVETFSTALTNLKPDGILVITRWMQYPPSEPLRMAGTVGAALTQNGYAVDTSLVIYRGIQTATLLAKPQGWHPDELAALRDFSSLWKFDLVWAPDIQPEETNRFNQLPDDSAAKTMAALLTIQDPQEFYNSYPFDISPTTDDHPFFYHFFTWEQTPEVIANLGRTWQPFGGSGYFVLIALLVLVVALSGLLILAPLMFYYTQKSIPKSAKIKTFTYFSLLGFGFLFVEIPLIQRWILPLGHPTYAFTIIVITLLVFSGIGSRLARHPSLSAPWLLGLLFLTALISAAASGKIAEAVLNFPLLGRAAAAAVVLAPLGILMGFPFPIGLAWLDRSCPSLIPWAWAINGCASVMASILAAIFSLSNGFTFVLFLGSGAYFGAWLVHQSFDKNQKPSPLSRNI